MSSKGRIHSVARMRAGVAAAVLSGVVGTWSQAWAADVTFERLLNPEPQNWLMNHHDFSSQRFSKLTTINRSNVKDLKLHLYSESEGNGIAPEFQHGQQLRFVLGGIAFLGS